MADNRKLAQGLMMMTPSARADLAQREGDIQRGKTVELLRRAGKEMYNNPIVNTAIGFTPVLGDVQAAGETMAALNRGAPWQETAGYAAGMLPFVPMIGKTVWHGSPHTFDKFDLSKIGTGEGAQAYGHGLYLAEAQDVAQQYQKDLTKGGDLIGGKPINQLYEKIQRQADRLPPQQAELEYEKLGFLEDLMQQSDAGAALKRLDNEDLLPWAEEIAKKWQPGGSLYKVDLPDEHIAKMLDWDKPLSEQSDYVRNLLTESGAINDISESARIQKYADARGMTLDQATQFLAEHPETLRRMKAVSGDATGNQIYRSLAKAKGGAAENGSQFLNELGIPGIQYLDQASRGAGEGTRNYVVFSDEIPQILERNGQPVAQALRNYESPQKQIANIPLSEIEHGESAMPGGKLSFPESRRLIKEYAEMPTEIPPIQVMAPDEAGGKWMIYDGSHRYEAAKLRGMNQIPVELENIDDIEAARKAGYLK